MEFDKFRNKSINTGKGILGVFSVCVIAVGLFILYATYNNKGEFNVNALISIIIGCVCFYVAMKRQVIEKNEIQDKQKKPDK